LARQTHFEASLRLANIGITSPILIQGGGGHWMGYSGYVGSELIPNSLGLGREAVLQELYSPGFSFCPTTKGNSWGSPFLKF
jgi:hypothetical protein